MLASTALFPTENGSRYLQQLCKHFAHKIDVSYDEKHGECRFSCGVAILDAEEGGLRIGAVADDRAQLEQTQDVIGSHLLRFAFREPEATLSWQDADPETI